MHKIKLNMKTGEVIEVWSRGFIDSTGWLDELICYWPDVNQEKSHPNRVFDREHWQVIPNRLYDTKKAEEAYYDAAEADWKKSIRCL